MAKPNIKLLVLDIDGTIAGQNNDVNPAVRAAVAQARSQGVHIAIATGRMYCSALRFHQLVGANLPVVAYQGAWIQDPETGIQHRHCPVSRDIAADLFDFLQQPDLIEQVTVHCYIDDQLYVNRLKEETADYASRSSVQPNLVKDLKSLLDRDPTKVLAMSADHQLVDELLGKMRQIYSPGELYLTKSTSDFFEMAHPDVNKGNAVAYLANQILQIGPENIMAIGDNFNDLEMLAYAGIGIAMGDAPAPVQEAANCVAPSVEEDGVVWAIEKFILA